MGFKMKINITHSLEPEQIESTIKNITDSSNDLVQKVLAEEITFKERCEKLETCGKEEFYEIRDELVDALNQYDFDETITEKKKGMLNYELFQKDIKELKKTKKFLKNLFWSVPSGGLSMTVAAGILFGPLGAVATGMISFVISTCTTVYGAEELGSLKRQPPKNLLTMKAYYHIAYNSVRADNFMKDIKTLKSDYPDMYKILTKDVK